MGRVLAGGAAVIGMALLALLALAAKHPWEIGTGVAVLLALAWIGRKHQPPVAFGLDVAAMSPVEYEQHCAEVLRRAGWRVQHVGRCGDQGVDVIAELRGIRAAVQCKRYAGRAGNDAVQQVVAGKRHYRAQLAVVVAPFGYTRAAQQLANANAALLMSHANLARLEQVARVP
jgi:HJR/Mrr/RecB family endonuclease